MHVFVAGGTGVVGQRLVPMLLARGHKVTATTTNPQKIEALEALGANAVVMNGLDARSVRDAVIAARPDTIVHQMTAIAPTPDMKHMDRWFAVTNRLRTEGTDHLLAAAKAAGVSHIVAQSYGGWNGIRAGGWLKTEQDPLDLHEGTPAEPVMAAVQYVEEAVTRAGGAALRFGWLYGPGASEAIIESIRKRQFPIVGGGSGHTSWLHVDDAASATVLAVEQEATGVFNIVDDEPAPAHTWLPYLAEAAGAKPPMRIPVWIARIMAGDVGVAVMTEGRGFSNAKARRELGWQPHYRSWRQGFQAMIDTKGARA